jgi:hypothetical protein
VRIDPVDAAAIMVVCGRGLRQWHPVITRNRACQHRQDRRWRVVAKEPRRARKSLGGLLTASCMIPIGAGRPRSCCGGIPGTCHA